MIDASREPGAVATDPAEPRATWERPALATLLTATAVLYLWGLGASGYANDYYAAAVQAASQSWSAMFFGAFDAGGAITVDKPPAALWVMDLSTRIFGFTSWSMLVPQALMGVGSVALLFAIVRRWFGPAAGLFAGAVFALTPVAVLMFRFNNPDALLVLLLLVAAYCVVRACETASGRWLAVAGVVVGAAFVTKMLAAFLVLPAFALVYLVVAPTGPWRRLRQVLVAGAAVVATAGAWVVTVTLWPAGARPYISGSATNNVLDLALGYNGLARIVGQSAAEASARGEGGGDQFAAGLTRLFDPGVGEQVSWLLPAALLALVIGLVVTRRAPRADRTRAGLLLWGCWLLVTAAVFTFMGGKFHPYYTVALAPAISSVIAISGRELVRQRDSWSGRGGLALLVLAAGGWSFVLLARTPSWHPEIRYGVALAVVLGVGLVLLSGTGIRRAGLALATVAAMLGSGGYAIATAAVPHTGADPSAGPAVSAGQGGRGERQPAALPANSELAGMLAATTTRWAAATSGAQSAAPLELASGRPVIGIGGFTGGDPAPTLAQFQGYVAAGEVRYFVVGGLEEGKAGAGARGGAAGTGAEISAWVAGHFGPTTVGGATVYDLSGTSS